MFNNSILNIKKRPYAYAKINGSNEYHSIDGIVYFYKVQGSIISYI